MAGLFDKVKASITPEQLLETLGLTGKKYAHGVRFGFCPACGAQSTNVFKIKLQGSCHCFQCGFTGSVIDLYAAMIGKNAIEAARELQDRFGTGLDETEFKLAKAREANHLAREAARMRQMALVDALKRLKEGIQSRNLKASEARRYLVDGRKIHPDVLMRAEKRGLVGYLDCDPQRSQRILNECIGESLLIDSGLMRPDANTAAIAYRPLVFFLPGAVGAEFRLIRPQRNRDEPKSIRYGELSYPFWWGGESSEEILIVEGVIDLLSIVSMGQKRSVMALPGCQAWRDEWIQRIYAKHGTRSYLLGLDSDKAGEESSQKIAKGVFEAGFVARRFRPSDGCKDWNDQLLASAK